MAEDNLRVYEKPEADDGDTRRLRLTRFVAGCALIALLAACGLLSRIDQIAVALVDQGELPEGLIAGDVQTTAPASLADSIPPKTETRAREFRRAGMGHGWVVAFVVAANTDPDALYGAVVGALGPRAHPLPGLGKQAIAVDPTAGYPAAFAFVRCGVVVVIRMDVQAMQPALDYTQRLDRRLATVACG